MPDVEKDVPEMDLPGMWSYSDFEGGDPDERSYRERADSDALAEALGRHLFMQGYAELNARCTCGHVYGNPNASEGYSHPRHVADVLAADGWTRPTSPGGGS